MSCPACSSDRSAQYKYVRSPMIEECEDCGAVFGTCYLGDSYLIASPILYPQTDDMVIRYFDLECLGSAGITRRHGWSDKKTGKMVQIG